MCRGRSSTRIACASCSTWRRRCSFPHALLFRSAASAPSRVLATSVRRVSCPSLLSGADSVCLALAGCVLLRGRLPRDAASRRALQHKTVDAQQVRRLVKQQFFLHAHETDETKIAKLKKNAMSALTNYVMHISVGYACPAPVRRLPWRRAAASVRSLRQRRGARAALCCVTASCLLRMKCAPAATDSARSPDGRYALWDRPAAVGWRFWRGDRRLNSKAGIKQPDAADSDR